MSGDLKVHGGTSSSNKWTTLDIVVVAVLGVAFGLLNGPMGSVYQFFQAAMGPVGAQIWGVFDISQVLAMFIVRKPGAAFINMLINGLMQMLAGNPAGAVTLGWGFTQGVGTELVFAAFRYRRFDLWACFLGGGIAQAFSNLWTFYVYGFWSSNVGILVFSYVLGLVTYGIMSGMVAYAIGRALKSSGVLKSFRSGAEPDIIRTT